MDTDVVLLASLLAARLPDSYARAAQPSPSNLALQTSNRAAPQHSHVPRPPIRPHRDDLGVELCWQGTRAGLGMEEAVKGLHGTGCHQLERTRRLSGEPTAKLTVALGSSISHCSRWAWGALGPPEPQTCLLHLDTQGTVALVSLGSHQEKK